MATKNSLSTLNRLVLSLGTISCLVQAAPPAISQDLGAGQAELIRQLRETGTAMKEYASKHDHFPNGPEESDQCLKMLFKRVSMSEPDSTLVPKSNGAFRTYYQFAIGIDPSYKSIPLINGIPKIPDNYVAPGSSIVIMTDGADDCVGWAAGTDGRPLTVQAGTGPLYFEAKIEPKTDSSDSSTNK